MTGTLYEDRHTFIIISRSVLLRISNVSYKSCRENQNTCFILTFPEKGANYDIMWKNVVEPDRPQMIIWRSRVARWIPKATHTHTHTQNM